MKRFKKTTCNGICQWYISFEMIPNEEVAGKNTIAKLGLIFKKIQQKNHKSQ